MNSARIRDATVARGTRRARRGATSAAAAHVDRAEHDGRHRHRPVRGARQARPSAIVGTSHRPRPRDASPSAAGQPPVRERHHAAERAGPQDGGVPEQHAGQRREPGAAPRMQREVPKVHGGRIELRPSIRSKLSAAGPAATPHASCVAMKRAGWLAAHHRLARSAIRSRTAPRHGGGDERLPQQRR